MVVVVVLDPTSNQSQNGLGIWQRRDLDVITLQRFHESLGDAVALRALDRCEAGFQAQLAGEDLRVLRDVGRAVVGQHLDDRQCAICAEAAFHGFEHDVADVGAADPGVHHGALGDNFPIMGINEERASDDLAIPAGELKPVAAPAQVRTHDDQLAFVNILGALGIFPCQQQVMGAHDPVDLHVVDRRKAF